MGSDWEEEVHREIDQEAGSLEVAGPTNPDQTNPETEHPLTGGRQTHRGTGRVIFEGDVEREQTRQLAHQIARASMAQQDAVAPDGRHVVRMRWIETDDPNKDIFNDTKFDICEFELELSNGKTYTITGPIMTIEITKGRT